jgi:hypothetical protein
MNGQKGQFGQVDYSTAKAGIHGFTMALAQEATALSAGCDAHLCALVRGLPRPAYVTSKK